jgi:hypothetical protein
MNRTGLLVLLLLLSGLAAAEVFTIGTGTDTQSYLPYDGSQDYGWSKIIYQASELSGAGLPAGPICGIGFHVANYPTGNFVVNQQVFIRHTQVGFYSLTDNAMPDAAEFQKVYEASFTWTGAFWNQLMFDSPFVWDGTSNLEIMWQNRDGMYSLNHPVFYATVSNENRAVYKHGIYLFPDDEPGICTATRPNTQFITLESTIPEPAVLCSPANDGYAMPELLLKWKCGNGVPTSYDLYFGTSNNPPFLVNLSYNSYPLNGYCRELHTIGRWYLETQTASQRIARFGAFPLLPQTNCPKASKVLSRLRPGSAWVEQTGLAPGFVILMAGFCLQTRR